MKEIRCAVVNGDAGIPWGGTKGASLHLEGVVKGFLQQKASVAVVSPRTESRESRLGEEIYLPEQEDWALEISNTIRRRNTTLAMELTALLNNGPIVRALERANAEKSIDFVYERASLFCLAGIRFARSTGIPHVLELNAPLILEQEKYRTLHLKDAALEIERELLQNTTAVCVVSEPLGDYVQSRGVPKERVHIVSNGVDGSRFHFGVDGTSVRRALHVPDDAFIVGFVGGLRPWHGLQLLADSVAAARRVNGKIYLVVVGEGPQRAAFLSRVAELGITEYVRMSGAVAHETVPQWIAACDVLTAPYESGVEDYFCPLKVAEALAVGRPVIASDLPAVRSILGGGASGIITNPGDIQQFTSAILQLASDPACVQRMGASAAALGSRYHWSAIAREIMRIADEAQVRRQV